ncbi:hypothetical protein D5266_02405 [bacterium c-19]|nr:hypothetical protein [bacterium c-19]
MNKRKLISSALALICAVVMGACGKQTASPDEQGDNQSGGTTEAIAFLNKALDKYESQPGLEMRIHLKSVYPEDPSGIPEAEMGNKSSEYVIRAAHANEKEYQWWHSDTDQEDRLYIFSKTNDAMLFGHLFDKEMRISSYSNNVHRSDSFNVLRRDLNGFMPKGEYAAYFDFKMTKDGDHTIVTMYCKDLAGYTKYRREHYNLFEDNPDAKYTLIEDEYFIDSDFNLIKRNNHLKTDYGKGQVSEINMTTDIKAISDGIINTEFLDSLVNDMESGKLHEGDSVEWKIDA